MVVCWYLDMSLLQHCHVSYMMVGQMGIFSEMFGSQCLIDDIWFNRQANHLGYPTTFSIWSLCTLHTYACYIWQTRYQNLIALVMETFIKWHPHILCKFPWLLVVPIFRVIEQIASSILLVHSGSFDCQHQSQITQSFLSFYGKFNEYLSERITTWSNDSPTSKFKLQHVLDDQSFSTNAIILDLVLCIANFHLVILVTSQQFCSLFFVTNCHGSTTSIFRQFHHIAEPDINSDINSQLLVTHRNSHLMIIWYSQSHPFNRPT